MAASTPPFSWMAPIPAGKRASSLPGVGASAMRARTSAAKRLRKQIEGSGRRVDLPQSTFSLPAYEAEMGNRNRAKLSPREASYQKFNQQQNANAYTAQMTGIARGKTRAKMDDIQQEMDLQDLLRSQFDKGREHYLSGTSLDSQYTFGDILSQAGPRPEAEFGKEYHLMTAYNKPKEGEMFEQEPGSEPFVKKFLGAQWEREDRITPSDKKISRSRMLMGGPRGRSYLEDFTPRFENSSAAAHRAFSDLVPGVDSPFQYTDSPENLPQLLGARFMPPNQQRFQKLSDRAYGNWFMGEGPLPGSLKNWAGGPGGEQARSLYPSFPSPTPTGGYPPEDPTWRTNLLRAGMGTPSAILRRQSW